MRRTTILVVEDNKITRRMFRVALESQGWTVVEAADGRSAIESFTAEKPDVVVQDLTLPDMDGLDLLKRLLDLPGAASVPIIATSGFLSKLEQARSLSVGFVEHLFKPVDPYRLIEVVRAHVKPPKSETAGRGRMVLVADDDPVQARLLRLQLEHAGFVPVVAASGAEVLAKARAMKPAAIVCDVLMPGMDGFALCLAVRHDPVLADVPVVLVSVAFTEEADRDLARRVGANALVVRSPEHASVIDALLESLQGTAPPVDPNVKLPGDDYTHRMVRQLERQVGQNAELAGRLALHEAAMGVLGRLGETAKGVESLEKLLPDLLHYALDAAGISIGAVYLLEPDGRFTLAAHHGFAQAQAGLADFFGRADLLARATAGDEPLGVPANSEENDWERVLLEKAGARALLLVPLRLGQQRLGALVLAAARRRLGGDWLPFAEAIGVQIAHSVALARAVRQIAREEERFRQLADSMPQIVWSNRADGTHDYYNGRWYTFSGLPRGTEGSEAWHSVIHPEDLAGMLERWRRSLETGEPYELEYRLRGKDQVAYRWHLGRAVPIRDASGAIVRWYGTATDIDDRKRFEERLRNSEETLRQITDNIQEVFWMADSAVSQIFYISPAYEVVWGRTRESLYADPRSWADAIHEADRDRVYSEILARQRDGETFDHTYRVVRPDGTVRWVNDRGFPVKDATGGVSRYVGTVVDITDLRVAEESLRKTEEQLRSAQKMEAVGRLAGGVSHDFNNLLTAIMGYSELILHRLDPRDPLRRDLEEIRKAGERASSLTRQLLVFSRRETVAPQVLDPNAVIADMEKMVRRLIGEDIELRVQLDRSLGRAKIDKGYLEQVVLNLCVNARDAMPRGGKLSVETSNVERNGAPHVRLSVTDTGCGMGDDVLVHLFEPFFTTKELGKGTGLGLSTVYGIVRGAGGEIAVESEVGRGSSFIVLLPTVAGDVSSPVGASAGPIPRGAETILLVEDDEMVRNLSLRVLEMSGYRVLVAKNGGEALLICEQHGGQIDLVVTDVVMPMMSGPELAARLEKARPKLRVLFCSGYTSGAIQHAEALGSGKAFIQKPFTPQALARKVREVLDGPEAGA